MVFIDPDGKVQNRMFVVKWFCFYLIIDRDFMEAQRKGGLQHIGVAKYPQTTTLKQSSFVTAII